MPCHVAKIDSQRYSGCGRCIAASQMHLFAPVFRFGFDPYHPSGSYSMMHGRRGAVEAH